MKTGMNLLLWTSHVTQKHYPILRALKKAGYDTVEIPIFEGTPDHYAKLGEELDRLGLGRSVVSVIGPSGKNSLAPDKQSRQAIRHPCPPKAEFTGSNPVVGAKSCYVQTGHIGNRTYLRHG